MSDYLPDDILIEIFGRLPIKPLVRCMVVCKSWYAFIASPHFLSLNLNHAYKTQFLYGDNKVDLSNELQCYILKHEFEIHYISYINSFKHSLYRYSLKPALPSTVEVVGNANGLICLCIDLFSSDPIIILWNPVIQRVLDLPRPNLTDSTLGKPHFHSFGFGYDHVSNDFKIVRIVQFKGSLEKLVLSTTNHKVVPPVIEVFKLSTGEWQVLNHVILPFQIDGTCFYSYLNGNLHWVGYGEKNRDAIVVFNLSNDEFKLMMLPDYILSLGKVKKVDVYEKSLALFILQYDDNLTMWIMGRYGDVNSWCKFNQFQFQLYTGHGIWHKLYEYLASLIKKIFVCNRF